MELPAQYRLRQRVGQQAGGAEKLALISRLMARRRAAQVAADILQQYGLLAVGHGDSWMLHEIAERLGMAHEGPATERKVLRRIGRTNRGEFARFIVSYPEVGLGRTVRFVLTS